MELFEQCTESSKHFHWVWLFPIFAMFRYDTTEIVVFLVYKTAKNMKKVPSIPRAKLLQTFAKRLTPVFEAMERLP